MVCNRCIKVVQDELSSLGFTIMDIELGEVTIKEHLSDKEMDQISLTLIDNGFELIDNKKSKTINRIKTLIIEFIHYDREKPEHMNLSDFLAKEIGHDYSYLSNLFSSVDGITIEKYLINQGLLTIKRNYSCRSGEIDLLMLDADTLAFIEVRFRSNPFFGSPAESITRQKIERLRKSAEHFLQTHRKYTHYYKRFDVMAISA